MMGCTHGQFPEAVLEPVSSRFVSVTEVTSKQLRVLAALVLWRCSYNGRVVRDAGSISAGLWLRHLSRAPASSPHRRALVLAPRPVPYKLSPHCGTCRLIAISALKSSDSSLPLSVVVTIEVIVITILTAAT